MVDFKLLNRKKKAAREAAAKQLAYYNDAEQRIYELGFISGTNWEDTENPMKIFLNPNQAEVWRRLPDAQRWMHGFPSKAVQVTKRIYVPSLKVQRLMTSIPSLRMKW